MCVDKYAFGVFFLIKTRKYVKNEFLKPRYDRLFYRFELVTFHTILL